MCIIYTEATTKDSSVGNAFLKSGIARVYVDGWGKREMSIMYCIVCLKCCLSQASAYWIIPDNEQSKAFVGWCCHPIVVSHELQMYCCLHLSLLQNGPYWQVHYQHYMHTHVVLRLSSPVTWQMCSWVSFSCFLPYCPNPDSDFNKASVKSLCSVTHRKELCK